MILVWAENRQYWVVALSRSQSVSCYLLLFVNQVGIIQDRPIERTGICGLRELCFNEFVCIEGKTAEVIGRWACLSCSFEVRTNNEEGFGG